MWRKKFSRQASWWSVRCEGMWRHAVWYMSTSGMYADLQERAAGTSTTLYLPAKLHSSLSQKILIFLCVLDRASSWYSNKGRPTRWHLLYYLLLNMFQTLIRPSSGACEYLLCCVGWFEACWCYVAGLSVCIRVQAVLQPTLRYHITNRQSRYITPARLKSAYTTQQVVASSWRWTY